MIDPFGDPLGFLSRLILQIPALLVAVTVHEFAHAVVADRLGDPTARRLGRLTLNPLPHIDPLGAIAFVLAGFGGAETGPGNGQNPRHPIRDGGGVPPRRSSVELHGRLRGTRGGAGTEPTRRAGARLRGRAARRRALLDVHLQPRARHLQSDPATTARRRPLPALSDPAGVLELHPSARADRTVPVDPALAERGD